MGLVTLGQKNILIVTQTVDSHTWKRFSGPVPKNALRDFDSCLGRLRGRRLQVGICFKSEVNAGVGHDASKQTISQIGHL